MLQAYLHGCPCHLYPASSSPDTSNELLETRSQTFSIISYDFIQMELHNYPMCDIKSKVPKDEAAY